MPQGMRLPMQRGETPRFFDLDEDTFQRLSNDVLAAEPDVMTSNEYGTRDHDQYGIDLLAPLHEGLAYVVTQCKRYKVFPPAQHPHSEMWTREQDFCTLHRVVDYARKRSAGTITYCYEEE